MQIQTFKYTKANGDVSQRIIMVISKPSKHVSGIDLTEIGSEAADEYASIYGTLLDNFNAEVSKLNASFDTNNRFRQFDPAQMTEVESVWVASNNVQ